MQIEFRKISELRPYEQNARVHSPAQVEQIAESIREFGFTSPLMIGPEGGVIAGHGRLAAAVKLGMADVPCVVLGHLTEVQRRALILADNKIALNSQWNDAILMSELAAIGVDSLPITGFSSADFAALSDIGNLSFDPPPPTVQNNSDRLAEMRAARKRGNEATAEKNDTEKYLVVVFPTRAAREAAVAALGLPADERYLDAGSVEIRLRFSVDATKIKSGRRTKASSAGKSGAGG